MTWLNLPALRAREHAAQRRLRFAGLGLRQRLVQRSDGAFELRAVQSRFEMIELDLLQAWLELFELRLILLKRHQASPQVFLICCDGCWQN